MTHTSIEDTEKLVSLLIARVAKNDCNIKYKVLMVVKVSHPCCVRGKYFHADCISLSQHVSRLGRSEFKRLMQGHVNILKTCLRE